MNDKYFQVVHYDDLKMDYMRIFKSKAKAKSEYDKLKCGGSQDKVLYRVESDKYTRDWVVLYYIKRDIGRPIE